MEYQQSLVWFFQWLQVELAWQSVGLKLLYSLNRWTGQWDGFTMFACWITSFGLILHSRQGEEQWQKNTWFQLFAHAQNFPKNLRNHVYLAFTITHNRVILVFLRWFFGTLLLVFFRYGCFQWQWLHVLISLALHIIYTTEGYSDWKPWRNDHVVIVYLFTLWWCITNHTIVGWYVGMTRI